jgi:NAD(P)-dependent dehydrogenase (short-subunit alcohol dehydrogenase family)
MAHRCASLVGKVAIVTGSSSGIGLATAVKFASNGTKVTLTGRNLEGLADAKKKCIAAGLKETEILTVPGEISDEHTREKLVAETLKAFGKIDILVNNAAVMPASPLNACAPQMDVLDKVFDVNIRAVVDLTMKAMPELIKTKGSVVNISSVGGMRPVAPFLYYCMTKSSLEMFSRGIAQEFGSKGVRCNTVSPGLVRTNLPMSAGLPKEALTSMVYENEDYINLQALNRVGEPEELANLIVFLASDGASYITGSNIVCDGGAMIKAHSTHTRTGEKVQSGKK